MFTLVIDYSIIAFIISIYIFLLELHSFSMENTLLYLLFNYTISQSMNYKYKLLSKRKLIFTLIHKTQLSEILWWNNRNRNKPLVCTTISGTIYKSAINHLLPCNNIFQMDLIMNFPYKAILNFNHI